ncbi:MAG: hypothetical protein RR280_01120 [Bacteroidaceae bacterium]
MTTESKTFYLKKGMVGLLRGLIAPHNELENSQLAAVREFLDLQAFSVGSSSWSLGTSENNAGVYKLDFPEMATMMEADKVEVNFYKNKPWYKDPLCINYHLWENKAKSLFTREIKQYNISKGFIDILQGKRVILSEGWESQYMTKLMEFLRTKLKQYDAEVFEVCHVPNMGSGLWSDDVTGDTITCEVVQVKFNACTPKQHFEIPEGHANIRGGSVKLWESGRIPADRPFQHQRSAVIPFKHPLNIEPLDFEDACEALRTAGFTYNPETDCWFKPEKSDLNRALKKHYNFPSLYGSDISFADVLASTSTYLQNLGNIAQVLEQQFKDMHEKCPALFDKPLDSKSDGEEDA